MAESTITLRLVADSGKLVGQVNVAKASLRDLGSEGDKTAASLTKTAAAATSLEKSAAKAGVAFTAAAGSVIAALAVLVKNQVDYAASLVTVSQRIGVSVEQLSALGAAAKRNDSDFKAVVSGLDALAESAARAGSGAGAGARQSSAAFAALGVSVNDANGQLRPTLEIMEDVARGLSKLPDGALKTRLATQLLGDAGKDLDGTLKELATGGMQGLMDAAAKTGEVISTQAAAQAKKFNDDLQTLGARIGVFGQGIAQDVLPTLLALTSALLDTDSAADRAGAQTGILRGFMAGLGEAVLVAKETFSVLFTMLFGGVDMLIGVGQIVKGLMENLVLAAASVAALATGQVALAKDLAGQASDALATGWEKGSQRIAGAWENIKSAGADADAKIKGYQDRIAQGNRDIEASAAAAAAKIALIAANAAAVKGTQFENVAYGSRSMSAADGAVAVAQANEAAAAQKRYADALAKTAGAHRTAADTADTSAIAEKRLDDQLDSLRGGLSETAKAQADYDKGLRQLGANIAAAALSGVDADKISRAQAEGETLLKQRLEETNAKIAARSELLSGNKDVAEQLAQTRDQLNGLSNAEAKYNAAVREANRLAQQAIALGRPQQEVAKGLEDRLKKLAELRDMDVLGDIVQEFGKTDPFLNMVDSIGKAEKALADLKERMGDALDPAVAEKYGDAIANANNQLGVKMVGSYAALLGSVRAFTREGSKSYQQLSAGMAALQIIQDAMAMRAAVIAVLTQGEGEPYSAWVRMAAMAAAVAPFLASIGQTLSSLGGGGGGPSAQSSEARQKTQGTGTVLGDVDAKSDSIAKAIDITAKATTALVGLNRGMLNALQALQNALGAAGNQLARGAGDAAFPGVTSNVRGVGPLDPFGLGFDPLASALSSDPIGKAIGGFLFGGSQKVIDQGIVIAGGTLQSMLDNIMVGAYQTIHKDGGLFGSDKTYDNVVGVSDQFSKQFQLVIGSIINTVRAGATALSILPADIEKAIAAYKVEEIRISLKGLSAEDQQKELQAVFSKIFDGLAGAVVPFVAQFQQVGEGLGETLVRVATEVQVSQEAFKQLGLAVSETDPEKFAQIADGLIAAAGGMDAFISGFQSFITNFAPESHQFQVASDALTSALTQAGLTLPATRDGMWELMQSLDATTEAGREQIATLLRLADTADQYYTALQKQTDAANKALDAIGGLGGGLSDFGKSIVDIHDKEQAAVDAANFLAQAQGREGASTVQIAQIHDWAAKQIAAALRKLQTDTRDIVAKLYGGVPASLDAINAQISALESATSDTSAIDDAASASNQLFEAWKSGIKSVQDYLDSMLLGDLSALTPEEQLAEAKRQLVAAQQAALGGDAEALAKLPQMADAFLRLERNFDASGADYGAQFEWVRQLLGSVAGIKNPGTEGSAQSPIAVAVTASPELQALYAARDAALAQQEADTRANLAQQLAQNLHDLAVMTSTPILAMIDLQGVALDKLAADMGVDLNNLTGSSVLALGNMATTLGLSLTDLTTALGLSLTDLGTGVTELTQRLGIDLGNLTVQSTETLAQLANSLGGDLGDLATSVGVDLGKLTDKQSLLNEALADTIDQLPDGTRDQLAPLLEAITDATNEADANSAIKALEDAVNLLAPDIRDQLAPYLAGVTPPDALTDLDYLSSLQDIGHDQLDVLRDIARGLNVPGYAVGTGYVPQTGLALIHEGESIFPAPVASWMRANGFPVVQAPTGGAASNDAMVVQLRVLNDKVDALTRATTAGTDKVASSVERGSTKADANLREIATNTRGGMNRSTVNGR